MMDNDSSLKRKAEGEASGAPVIKKETIDEETSNSNDRNSASNGNSSENKRAIAISVPDDDDKDWDDDKSITDNMVIYMKKRAIRVKEKQRLEQEKAEAERVKKQTKRSSGTSGSKPAAAVRKDSIFYETKKGQLVQRLLVRWWYAYQWPLPGDWDASQVPEGYEELDGFPGVFVSLDVGTLGRLLDLRNNDNKPSLRVMCSKHAKVVQELCVAAYEGQMKALEDEEGAEAPLLRTLKRELRQVREIDAEVAEREARGITF